MIMRRVLFCASIALGSIALPAAAAQLIVEVAPPAVRYEAVPAPREGYAWAPGYWRYENQRHEWAPGRWQEARPGSYWVPDTWEAREGRHYYQPGRWEDESKRVRR